MHHRKNGKTSLAAALGVYHLIADSADTAPVAIAAAGDRSQARLVHDEVKLMIQASPDLSAACGGSARVRHRACEVCDRIAGGSASRVMIVRARDVDAAIARTILSASFPQAVAEQPLRLAWTLDFVGARVRGTSTVVRLGVRMSAFVLGSIVRAAGVDVRTGEPDDIARALHRWLDLPLPVLAEYTRLVRSLTLVAWFDAPESVRS